MRFLPRQHIRNRVAGASDRSDKPTALIREITHAIDSFLPCHQLRTIPYSTSYLPSRYYRKITFTRYPYPELNQMVPGGIFKKSAKRKHTDRVYRQRAARGMSISFCCCAYFIRLQLFEANLTSTYLTNERTPEMEKTLTQVMV